MAIESFNPGTVYLVGAGPGDPELLTRKAHRILQSADVIAYDELISAELRAEFPSSAIIIPVGRRCGQGETSYRLHPKVIEHALAGRSVARLKAGDPFVFGRGGEEIQELQSHRIPYEIVPGISAAFGAAASAGVPLTYRGVASKLTFIAGHSAAGFDGENADAGSANETTVLYMASRRIAANVARLISQGVSERVPVMCIASATQAGERRVVGTLSDIVEKAKALPSDAPVLVIVGEVVRFAPSETARQSLRTHAPLPRQHIGNA